MNLVAAVVLLGWLPVVVLLFSIFPPRKMVVYLYVCAWLFLPEGGFGLPMLPDYTKMSATVIGILFSAFAFDSGKILSLRLRWFDVPVLVFCLGDTVTAFTNGLTTWDALAMLMGQLISWGLPYLVGRAYLTDLESFTELARAIVIGALLYVPLCLFEIRMSPILGTIVYGMQNTEGTRYGGFRPRVFLLHGLALGAWMMNSGLTAYVLWSAGTIKSIRNVPFGFLTLTILVTMVLCKSTGATIIMATGLAIFWLARRTGKAAIVWAAIAIAPTYCAVRTLDLWSGQQLVEFIKANLGEDRSGSLQYRLTMERLLADRALEQPIFGWGGFNRFQVIDPNGKIVSVPDGFWIIVFGQQGLVGLVSIMTMFLLPMCLVVRRFPPSTWKDPRVAPLAALSLMLTMMMIDCLSNAMLMPLYPFAIGGLMNCGGLKVDDGDQTLRAGHELAEEGRIGEAAREYQRAIELAPGRADLGSLATLAEAHDGIGRCSMAAGRADQAAHAFREALALRDELAAASPDPGRFRDLADARDALARALAELGDVEGAIEERRIALELWDALTAGHPGDADYRDGRADALNDLSWLLTTAPGAPGRDPSRALALAEEAVRIAPAHAASWNTLGVARYRAGDWAGAIEALEQSTFSGTEPGGTAFDHYFLAMAWCRLQRQDNAGVWLERGKAWADRHRPGHADLARFRREAESLILSEEAGQPA